MLKAPKGFIDENDPAVCKVGHPAPPWMSSYADLMTELVCFFVILYALSAALNKNVQNAAQQVKDMIDKKEMNGSVSIDKDGLKITIEEQGKASFFSSGSAETTAEIDNVIQKLAPTLRKLAQDHDILVEGHTDGQRVSGALTQYFDSNWELSAARATSVARLLVDKYGLPPNHVGAVGYGEFRPIASNDTPEGRAMNRRVVFFVKNVPSTSAPPKGAAKSGEGARALPPPPAEPSSPRTLPPPPDSPAANAAANAQPVGQGAPAGNPGVSTPPQPAPAADAEPEASRPPAQ